jgi:NAD(P)H-nitrite reductase large subunit
MDLDDELCLCFHVSKRKVINYLRVHRPKVASQLADCGGAGTGCGWCVPFLKKLHRQELAGTAESGYESTAADYARARAEYVRAGKGTPPPAATPVEAE